jgi:uncharacterized membrane protein
MTEIKSLSFQNKRCTLSYERTLWMFWLLIEPTYLEFAYFSFGIGITIQLSDAAVALLKIQKIAVLHSYVHLS